MRCLLITFITVFLFFSDTLVFASNGKIAGWVKDSVTGNPLANANILVFASGTSRQATTDQQGRYFILNISPGQYTVQASFVGYQKALKTHVKSQTDLTIQVNFELVVQEVEGDEIVIQAAPLRVDKSHTDTRTSIGLAELNNTMPVSDLQDLIDTAPSVFKGFTRGGRKLETKILIDGIDISDTYFRAGEGALVIQGRNLIQRSSASEYGVVGINAGSVQALDVISGIFNAEYDAASAGVINVVTREGGPTVSGQAFFRTSPGGTRHAGPDVYNDLNLYNRERDHLLNSKSPEDQHKGTFYTFDQQNIQEIGYANRRPYEAEFSVGGPFGDQTRFFATARFFNTRGHLPNEFHQSLRYSLKLTHMLSSNLNLTGKLIIDDGGKLGGWSNRDFNPSYKYFPQAFPQNKKLGLVGYVGLTHLISPNAFYEIKISQMRKLSEFGFSDDNGDGVVERNENGAFIVIKNADDAEKYVGKEGSGVQSDGTPTFFTSSITGDPFYTLSFSERTYRFGKPPFYYEKLSRNVTQFKGDLTYQLNFHHQLKTGIQFRRHAVSDLQQKTQITTNQPSALPYGAVDYTVYPQELALYVQDRMEFEGIVVNAGVRVDGFDVGVNTFGDFAQPLAERKLDNGQVVLGQSRTQKVGMRWFAQPRLGISHTISENAAMHYSWGKLYTVPTYSILYENFGAFTSTAFPVAIDVGMDPLQTTAYEIGIRYAFAKNYLLDLTAYYRDTSNYNVITYTINLEDDAYLSHWNYITNFGFADSRGIECTLERQLTDHFLSGRLNYAYSYIKTSNLAAGASPYIDQTSFNTTTDKDIPFESRYGFNTVVANATGGGNPLTGGYDREHQFSLSLLAQLPYKVHLSMLSQAISGFIFPVTETTSDLRSRETARSPWTWTTDLRITRTFSFGERLLAHVFFETRNLLNRKNIRTYDNHNVPSKALWETSIKEGAPNPTGNLNRAFTNQGLPIYDLPREINLGLTLDF